MLAGLSLNSCDEKDNAIIDGKVWIKPEVTLTDGGATITGSSPADISRMIGRIRQEIIAAAQKGETFTLDIETPVLNATSSDNAISIPTVTDGDIVVNFKSAISTEAPLVLESKGVADDAPSTDSSNKVEINIPSSSGADLQINMPTSTVTLNAASGSLNIDELVAKTAVNTLNIAKGVTVNWLKVVDGRAIVEDGAKVLGFIRNGDGAYANENGFEDYNVSYPDVEGEPIKPYYVQNLKIEKGEAALVRVFIANAKAEDALESIIIADGAAAGFYFGGDWDDKGNYIEPKGVKLVKGLGNKTAKIYTYSRWTRNEDGTTISGSNINLTPIKELSNITVDGSIVPDVYQWDESKQENVALGNIEAKFGGISLGPNSTDCDFIAPEGIHGAVTNNIMSKVTNCNLVTTLQKKNYNTYIYTINAINSKLTADNISEISPNSESTTFKGKSISFTSEYESGNSATLRNCKFETSDKEPEATIEFPYQTKDRSEFNFGFDTCDFAKGFKFNSRYATRKPWLDKDGKPVTKGYYWYVLNEDGEIDWTKYIIKCSTSLDDVPAANKANYKEGWMYYNGYWIEEGSNGLRENAYFNDFKGYITLKNSTLDGKAITSKTDMIGYVENNGTNEEGEQATKTYYVIDGVTYEVVKIENEGKYRLYEAE